MGGTGTGLAMGEGGVGKCAVQARLSDPVQTALTSRRGVRPSSTKGA